MDSYTLTKEQARQFILIKQGLLGDYRFHGKEGIIEYISQAGCVQFDPIDVCGKNAELVLQSRVEGFTKQMIYDLLYVDRRLIDYFDKNLSIMGLEDWVYFERSREASRNYGRGRDEVDKIAENIKTVIRERGSVCSKDLEFDEKVDWYWSSTKLSRAALETLYFRGDLIIHHKKGTIKYYALAEDYIPKALLSLGEPLPDGLEHLKWRVLRRISAVGLLWNKPSDAWLGIRDFKAEERNAVFASLKNDKKINEVQVEGCKDNFYYIPGDSWIIDIVSQPDSQVKKLKKRTELIAPLDGMMWDRKLIKAFFDFDYKWEIYTPVEQRKYGYYVLPVLSGDRFVGRVELVNDRKNSTLLIKNIWFEKDIEVTEKLKKDMDKCFRHFQEFHGMKNMIYHDNPAENMNCN